MAIFARANERVMKSHRLEYLVRQYGPDFISTYGGGTLLAASAVLASNAVAPFIAIPAAAGLVSFVNQLDHDYDIRSLTEAYRDQIAAVVRKDPLKITPRDLYALAYDTKCPNQILKCEVENIDRRRDITIGLHAASAGLFGVIAGFVLPLLSGVLALPLPAVGVGFGALLLFQQIDRAVSDVGRSLMDFNRETGHGAIQALEDSLHSGRSVSEMEVFKVMVNGNNELSAQIKREYGASFEDLYLSDKHKAMQQYGAPLHLAEITNELNRPGTSMEASDLVLILCGQEPAAHALGLSRPRPLPASTRRPPSVLNDLSGEFYGVILDRPANFFQNREEQKAVMKQRAGIEEGIAQVRP